MEAHDAYMRHWLVKGNDTTTPTSAAFYVSRPLAITNENAITPTHY